MGVKARQPCCSNTDESDYNNDISEKSFEFQVLLQQSCLVLCTSGSDGGLYNIMYWGIQICYHNFAYNIFQFHQVKMSYSVQKGGHSYTHFKIGREKNDSKSYLYC